MAALSDFAASLTAPNPQPPRGLAGPVARRFAVYRNNVAVGLIGALEARFPAVCSLVGEEFFGAMARDFIRSHPPTSPVLMTFGDGLPGFLEGFEPASDLPYLADIARIEVARTRAYHAADAPRLEAAAFAALPPDALDHLTLTLHPAVSLVRSPHPVWDILAAANGAGASVTDWTRQAVIIDRPDLDCVVRCLPDGTAAFLSALGTGMPLAAATHAGHHADPAFDLATALTELIGSRLASHLSLPEGAAS